MSRDISNKFGMSWAMDNPSIRCPTSPVQPIAAHSTKCSWTLTHDQRKFRLNVAHEQTVQRVHQVQKDLLSLSAAAPLRRQRGHLGGGGGGSPPTSRLPPRHPPPPPWPQGRAGDDSLRGLTSPLPLPLPLLHSAGGGDSILQRNLSASGAMASQLHWLPCNQTPIVVLG